MNTAKWGVLAKRNTPYLVGVTAMRKAEGAFRHLRARINHMRRIRRASHASLIHPTCCNHRTAPANRKIPRFADAIHPTPINQGLQLSLMFSAFSK